ncbi:epidermal growth factor receptor substrate 15-like 1 [Psammomys obesus]|uniref:epidermal growth factor receptor substrate 15-like 1 n=1 Tax=Psammomys obesus TaxID=48139 RepID=UPI002452B52B|nr:epidermal growth factor receptor substrate 15-like 1 [Psammomys obesus]
MAAPLVPLSQQVPSGNPLYESYYKQVDPAYTGRVGASEAALFLKKSGLSDIILGKIWDLADPEGKGFLDKQGFYVALRLVACAQSGHEVTLSNLNLTMPPPKFHDTSSPLMATQSSAESHWAVRVEEKAKFDGIFESLLPLNGLLSGDKVKPVLMNSKLPLDVLGRVWDLSDIDKDGHLDRDEFAVVSPLFPVPTLLKPKEVVMLEDPFKNKALLFSNNSQELHPDPFQAEDPFKSDPFKGADPFKGDPFQNDPFSEQQATTADPFGGDPFKESDPFHSSTSDDFFKKQTKNDPFTSDPFTKNSSLPSKLDPFESSDPFSSSSISSKGSDPFGTLDPFGSSSFSSAEGFADFSQMSKPPPSGPFSSSLGGAGFSDDPFKSKQDTPALPPKKPAPPRPKPPSGQSTPVSQLGSSVFPEPPDPFQPLGADSGDPFQNKKGFGDPFSGKDPFAPSSSAKPPKASSSGFADFTSFGNEEQQLAWAKRESEKAEQERLARLRRQEQEDLELAIALSKADMPA